METQRLVCFPFLFSFPDSDETRCLSREEGPAGLTRQTMPAALILMNSIGIVLTDGGKERQRNKSQLAAAAAAAAGWRRRPDRLPLHYESRLWQQIYKTSPSSLFFLATTSPDRPSVRPSVRPPAHPPASSPSPHKKRYL